MNASYSNEKPGLFTAIAVMTLTSGIINLFWGFIASAAALGTIIGVVCLPLTILPTILGIFEIIYAAKLLSNQPQPVQTSPSIAVFQILTFMYGNIFSMVVGILNLIFFNDQSVREYFSRINGSQIQPLLSAAPSTRALPGSLPETSGPVPSQPVIDAPAKPKGNRGITGK